MSDVDSLQQIIAGCKAGSTEAFSQLVDLYASRCYAYFYRLTGSRNTSDDLLSKLFVRLLEKIGSYKGGSFDKWLFRTAVNIFYDHLRRQQRRKKLLEQRKRQLLTEPEPAEKPDFDTVEKLQTQLAKLDADTRDLIMLRFYSQLSFKDIADIRNRPIGTVLAKVHRGLKKLRQLMEQGPLA